MQCCCSIQHWRQQIAAPSGNPLLLQLCTVLQGIEGHSFYGNCVVPIIENTARECELTDRMRQAIRDYPQANAVLVRRHGEQQPASSPASLAAQQQPARSKCKQGGSCSCCRQSPAIL
eukprot:GHUV01031554.1.p1 GENE.GHUV01031554.1~~GHUV01031554.1.p1  ORF type:complete len:118 (-),score=36.94 GHUV01031554.1:444-797(-)